MVGSENYYGVFLAFFILVPLGLKWDIEKKISASASVAIGFVSGYVVGVAKSYVELGILVQLSLQSIIIILIAGMILFWRFYRDPDREPPPGDKTIVSPADGKIIYIKEATDGQLPVSDKNGKKYPLDDLVRSAILTPPGTLIGISMNFLNVHVNRSPIAGKIVASKPINGKFISLRNKEAVFQNERRLTIIDNGNLKVGVLQIASRLVRNIVSFVNEGCEVKKGDRIGIIRFGSQVDLYIPHSQTFQVSVKVGQIVKAGESVIAYL
jgi:phosphatidylserine decarboxylase